MALCGAHVNVLLTAFGHGPTICREVAHSFPDALGRSDLHLRSELFRDDVLGCSRIDRDGQLVRVALCVHGVDTQNVQVSLSALGLLLVLRVDRDEVSHCQSWKGCGANRHLLILIEFLQCREPVRRTIGILVSSVISKLIPAGY